MKKEEVKNKEIHLIEKELGSDLTKEYDTIVKGLMAGKGLFGTEGLLKPLIGKFVEAALAAELESHLEEESLDKSAKPNKKNGKQTKRLRTQSGDIEIGYSRDRTGSFEPITVKKRQHELNTGFDNQILELYAMSNSIGDIRLHLEKMYGTEMSEGRISAVINGTWEVVDQWHKRPIAACYVVMFCDAIHISVCRNGHYSKVAVYVMYGVSTEGRREIIGIYVGQGGESATEWGRCLEDLKSRGLQDCYIFVATV